jgi:hypothetical protein
MAFKVPEQYREAGEPGTKSGMFKIGGGTARNRILVVASDGMEWEHVSVSKSYECPTWSEMCKVKDLFWDPEDCVIQYHPPRSAHISLHPYCLHMWRPIEGAIPMPPEFMV